MKKSRIALMLVISVMMALGAAALAGSWLEERMADREAAPDESAVVTAAMEIPFGQTVRAEDLRLAQLPPEAVPGNSFDSIEDVEGRVAAETMYPGEVVLEQRVVEHQGGSALGAILESGKRAVTVRVDDVAGVAGFLLPENRVDVVAARREQGSRDVESETILEDVKVLAVDQIASPEEKDGPVLVRAVTLAVTPRQAERVVTASQEGKIRLTLRNPLDEGIAQAEEEKVAEPEPEPEPTPKQTSWRRSHVRVTVIRGNEESTSVVHDH